MEGSFLSFLLQVRILLKSASGNSAKYVLRYGYDVGCVYYQQLRFNILKCQMSINRKSVLNKNHKFFRLCTI